MLTTSTRTSRVLAFSVFWRRRVLLLLLDKLRIYHRSIILILLTLLSVMAVADLATSGTFQPRGTIITMPKAVVLFVVSMKRSSLTTCVLCVPVHKTPSTY